MKLYSIEYTDFFEKEFNTNAIYISLLGDLLIDSIDYETGEIDNEDFSTIVEKSNNSDNIIDSLYYISNITGNGINHTGNIPLEQMQTDFRKRTWYINALFSPEVTISEVYNDLSTSKPCITISYKIEREGKKLGVLSGDIFLENLTDYYFNITEEDDFCVNVISPNGSVIFNENKSSVGKSFSSVFDEGNPTSQLIDKNLSWENILENTYGDVEFISFMNEHVYSHYNTSSLLGWKVFCIAKNSTIIKDLNQFLLISILIGILSCFIIILIFYLYFNYTDNYDKATGLINLNQFFKYIKLKYSLSKNIKLLFVSISNLDIVKSQMGDTSVNDILKSYSNVLKSIVGKESKIALGNEKIFIISFYTDKNKDELKEITNNIIKEATSIKVKTKDDFLSLDSTFLLIDFPIKHIKDLSTNIQLAENIIQKKQSNISELTILNFKDLVQESNDTNIKLKTIKKAINNDSIVPFYQPIYNINKNTVAKYEVLMRIKTNEEYLAPYPYILIAEKFNLIDELDMIVLEKALKYKTEIDPMDKLVFSFNVSGNCLNDDYHLSKASALIDSYKINHKNIEFEITETKSINNLDFLVQTITKYNAKGYSFSIDDFGVAYSNIEYIKRIPCTSVKIDGSFIKDINVSKENLYLATAMVSMAKAYHKKTVAEFIENREVLDTVKKIGVNYGQGFYLGRPSQYII
ncbi:EAL domain-containing protein [Clostridium sp. DL1XJH146]